MRLIDPIELKRAISVSSVLHDGKTLEQIIDEQPTIEQPEIIHCKDCYYHPACPHEQYLGLDGFCSHAEQREEEE